jgi:hypothetical protein
MRPQELIGKRAIRTKPVSYGDYLDNSFSVNPIRIIKVTNDYILYEYCAFPGLAALLDEKWLDDNWADYDEWVESLSNAGENLEVAMDAILDSLDAILSANTIGANMDTTTWRIQYDNDDDIPIVD